jgi:hypothetical protein
VTVGEDGARRSWTAGELVWPRSSGGGVVEEDVSTKALHNETIARSPGTRQSTQTPAETVVESIHAAIAGIRFGEVRVIIQDGVVIQIDRLEKNRLK